MFCQAAQECGYALPNNIEELMGGRTRYGPEEMLDTCERVTYTQPVDMLLDRLDQSTTEDFDDAWKAFIESHEQADEERLTVASEGRGSEGPPSLQGSPGTRALRIQALVNP